MEIKAVPGGKAVNGIRGSDQTLPFDCQTPITVEVSRETSFKASRVELAWAGFKEDQGCNLFCSAKMASVIYSVILLSTEGKPVYEGKPKQCTREGANSNTPCTIYIDPPVEASKIKIKIQGCSSGSRRLGCGKL